MPAGRPPKYTDPDEMQEVIDKYFADCDVNDKPYTISGLALALGMSTEALRHYGERDEFVATIKGAKLKCENYLEEALVTRPSGHTGLIFSLKNNYGWKDKTEQDVNLSADERIKRKVLEKINKPQDHSG